MSEQKPGLIVDNYKMEVIKDGEQQSQDQNQQQDDNLIQPKRKRNIQKDEDDEEMTQEEIEKPVNILSDFWTFWYSPRGRNVAFKDNDYTSVQKNLGSFNTIEDFFSFYCYFKRPSSIPIDHKLCCFRQNTRPAWEDYPKGGTWIIMFRKTDYVSINLTWEILLLALIGEQFDDSTVVGVLLSIRSKKNLIELWINDSSEKKKMEIGEKLCQLLNIDMQNVNLYFKNHASSLKESSTMRGAESFTVDVTPQIETPIMDKFVRNPADKKELEEFDLDA